MLKNAPIILLDEATASLDPENEVLVQKAIAKLVEDKTVIMIAHRLRSVVGDDQIFVLDDGKLVESGTHSELMEKKGLYQRLYHIQQESLGWAVQKCTIDFDKGKKIPKFSVSRWNFGIFFRKSARILLTPDSPSGKYFFF